MIRLLLDHNVRDKVFFGLRHRREEFDVLRARDFFLNQLPDPELLEWAFANNRILLTYDLKTMPEHIHNRFVQGASLAGVFLVHEREPTRMVLAEMLAIDECSDMSDWTDMAIHLPWLTS